MHETSKLKAHDTTIYQEGISFLKSEAAEDERARAKHGTDRWSRQPSQEAAERLYAQVMEIDGYLKSAASSDDLVKGKLKDNEKVLDVLSGSNRDIEEYVPSSRKATMPPNVERAAYNLRSTLDEVTRLENRRKRQIEKLRDKAKEDDISRTFCPWLSEKHLLMVIQIKSFWQKQLVSSETSQCKRSSQRSSRIYSKIAYNSTTMIKRSSLQRAESKTSSHLSSKT